MDKDLEVAKEIARINLEKNIPVEILIEKYKKSSIPATTQRKEHRTKINDSITE